MGSRSRGGYKDVDTYAWAMRIKREQEFPRPVKVQAIGRKRAASINRRKRKRWRRKRKN